MSSSIFRGEIVTSPEIKGIFTEAEDELNGKAFSTLVRAVKENKNVEASVIGGLVPNGDARCVFIHISGLVIVIDETGAFEIAEGAA